MNAYARALAVVTMFVSACGVDDPDAALAALVADAEAAAEARDTGHFRALIAASYADGRGYDRDRLIDVIRGYFFTNSDIEVVTHIEEVELFGDDAARLVVIAGILGRRSGAGVLPDLDGRLYRIELELIGSGADWQVIGANWDRTFDAQIGD